jgi:hypothetical protein
MRVSCSWVALSPIEVALMTTSPPVSEPVGDDRLYRTMVVVRAPGSDDAAARLTEDPWIRSGVLVSTSIGRWEVLVGDPAAAASDA